MSGNQVSPLLPGEGQGVRANREFMLRSRTALTLTLSQR